MTAIGPVAQRTLSDGDKSRNKFRLFYALLVPAAEQPWFEQLSRQLRRGFSVPGKPISADRLHISLAGIWAGDSVPGDIAFAAQQAGRAIRFEQFDISLDTALSYRNTGPRKPFVIAGQGSRPAVNRLGRQIGTAFQMISGRQLRHHRQISPHMTLVWSRADIKAEAIDPIIFPAREITLVLSHDGESRYDILGCWSFVP